MLRARSWPAANGALSRTDQAPVVSTCAVPTSLPEVELYSATVVGGVRTSEPPGIVEVPSTRYSLPAVYFSVLVVIASVLTGIETWTGALLFVPLTAITWTTAGAFCAAFGRFAEVYLLTSYGFTLTVGLAVVPLVKVTCGPLTYDHS